MIGYRNCKIGDVVKAKYADEVGYGFGITSDRGNGLVFFAFPTEEDAEQARAEIDRIFTKAVEITPQGWLPS
jgi:hypothetical protein